MRPSRTTSLFSLLIACVTAAMLVACGGSASDQERSRTDRLKEAAERAPDVAAPSREDVLLIKRMQTATTDEVKEYIGEVVQMELPEDFIIPQDIIDAGHPRLAADVIADRYPEFNGRDGMSLVQAVRANPVLYRQVVMESKAMRKVYKDHETVRRDE